MKIKAYAKINLGLQVIGKRDDGYHELDMVMAPIDLHDLIYVDKIKEGIIIESNNPTMPTNEKNIAYRAAKLMIERFNIKSGVKIQIFKHIPTQAGLAGGSADGAAVFIAMNKLFNLGLTKNELAILGSEIGSDIPFCIQGCVSRVTGVGESIRKINNNINCKILLIKPKKGVSTKKAFTSIAASNFDISYIDDIEAAIVTGDYALLKKSLYNDLESTSTQFVPEIMDIKNQLLDIGFDACLMSGSGSTVFAITKDDSILNAGYTHFKKSKCFVRKTSIINEIE